MMHSGAPAASGHTAAEQPPPHRPPTPNSTTNNENELLASLTQLSLETASTQPLPPTPTARSTTPRSTSPSISRNTSSASRNTRVSSPLPPTSARKPKPAPFGNDHTSTAGPRSPALRRQASASTLDARSRTPTLLRKASMNSLQKANNNAVTMNGGSNSPRALSRRSSYSQDTASMGRHSAMGRSPLNNMDGTIDERPPKPIVTAESIAHDYFTKEMATQHTPSDHNNNNINLDGTSDEKKETDTNTDTETVVILHDACYGHRFSRPKTSKASLLTIVERPERIHASILGVAAAYVKLGELGSGDKYSIKPPKAPVEADKDTDGEKDKDNKPPKPFEIRKSTRRMELRGQAVTTVHGVKWMEELKLLCEGAEAKLALNGKELVRPVMDRGKGAEEPTKFHEGDLYLCSKSLDAMEGALGAVCDGVDAVFADGGEGGGKAKRAFVVVRPPGHHCSASYPSGFCWVNNVHVGIQHAALHHGLTHVAIIDFDLHHGDGSQDIAWEHNARVKSLPKSAPSWKKTSIGYFSIHDINSYPCEWGDMEKVKNASLCIDNAHGQNIWNVHLAPWKSEDEFWKLYENKYAILLEKTRLFLKGQTDRIVEAGKVKPRAAIFLSAGFDASEHESGGMQRHKVNVPTEFYARLTRDVRRIAEEEGTSVEGRIVSVLEGGYSDRALCSGVFSHISGLAGSDPSTHEKAIETTGLGAEVARRMGSFSFTSTTSSSENKLPAYDASWWGLPNLEALEALEDAKPEPEAPKKPRENGPPATYYASTQSFDAKIVTESSKGRRSSSGLFAHPPPHGYKPSSNIPLQEKKAPTPPPPEVTWAVASKALAQVIIPTDRQTISCGPEDLNAAATRERKERQSLTLQGAKDILVTPPQSGPVSPEPTPSIRKSTRERKPARPVDTAAEESARQVAASRASRRRTVAGVGVLATEPSRPALPARGSTARQVPTTSRVSSRRASLASNTTADTVMGGMSPPSLPRAQGNDGAAEQSQAQSRTSTRPSTSSSSRAESAMSTRGAASGVAVRKTRAPATSTVTAPRASAAGAIARAPVGRQSSGSMAAPVPVRRASGAAPTSQAHQVPQVSSRPGHADGTTDRGSEGNTESRGESADIDSMTKGMGKVRITLLTKSQREAKEAKEAKAVVEAKSAAVAKAATEANNAAALEEAEAIAALLHDAQMRGGDELEDDTKQHHKQMDGATDMERKGEEVKREVKRESIEGKIAMFEAAQPSISHTAAAPNAPLAPKPPAALPVGVRGGELPIWSSTGAIPFASLSQEKIEAVTKEWEEEDRKEEEEVKKEKQRMDSVIWEVPETPQKNSEMV